MLTLLPFLLQVAPPPADIKFRANITARSLTIQKQGDVRLDLTANGRNVVDVQAPKANGRKTISNPVITVNVEARIADPAGLEQPPETSDPQ